MSAELRNVAIGMIFGSILSLLGLGYLANSLYGVGGHDKLADPVIEGAENTEAAAAEASDAKAAPAAVDIATLMASAKADKGAKTFKKKCTACHTSEQGGKNRVGPNLFSVTKRGIGKLAGFKYSKNMKKKSSEQWTVENLNAFLTKPASFVAKTKMSFAGIKKAPARADLIAFLKSNGG